MSNNVKKLVNQKFLWEELSFLKYIAFNGTEKKIIFYLIMNETKRTQT